MDYFRYDMIKRIAGVLCSLENADLRTNPDPLRSRLVASTDLPFAPQNYKVWRNYKRVFGACLLATDIDGHLICTEFCHRIAAPSPDDMAADFYFGSFIRRFYYPAPIFEGYAHNGPQHFPGCAILKFLLARLKNGQKPTVTVDEIIGFIVANNRTGEETVESYTGLKAQKYIPANEEIRQVRELVRFVSQISFLKWVEPHLYLDVDATNSTSIRDIEKIAEPEKHERNPDASRELLAIGRTGGFGLIPLIPVPADNDDLLFSEGKPKRVTHLRYERSARLRDLYFKAGKPPFLCDMCRLDATKRYPWTANLLEVHHLLPLASPLRIEKRSTSLSELVGICPNCHKATHLFYQRWLDGKKQDDFVSYQEARAVYAAAKDSIQN